MKILKYLLDGNIDQVQKYLLVLFLSFISIYLPAQEVAFAPPVDVATGSVQGVSALDAADFNGDGLKDVAVFEGGEGTGGRVTVAWFEQKPNGTWVRHNFGHSGIIGSNSTDFVGATKCGDIDGDGDQDVIVCVDGHGGGPIKIYLFDNPGVASVNNTWPKIEIASISGRHANDVAIADMDGDKKKDVIVRHKDPHDILVIFQNTKTNWTKKYIANKDGEGLSVGDLNGDKRPDISVSGDWYKAPASPRTESYQKYTYTNYTNIATKEDIGDINGDGRNDVLLSPCESYKSYGTPGEIHDLAWFECPANPESTSSWTKHVVKSNFNDASFVRLADFDLDGDSDIVNGRTWNGPYIMIYFNQNKGADFSQTYQVSSNKGGYSGAVKDMDGDGDMDIVAENTYSNRSKPYYYKNLYRQGTVVVDTQAPSVPGGLAASSVAQTSLTISWSASTDNVGVTAYEIFKDGPSVGTSTSTTMTITDLKAGTVYTFKVKAKDATGNTSVASTGLEVKTTEW